MAGLTALLLSWFPQNAADEADALAEMASSAGPSRVAALVALGALQMLLDEAGRAPTA